MANKIINGIKSDLLGVLARIKSFKVNPNLPVIGGSGGGMSRFLLIPIITQMNTNYFVADAKDTVLFEVGENPNIGAGRQNYNGKQNH